ncbi:MAG TPA: three-Cys-motif partner protein TcmP, partial [Gemmatimonadales bacterium]|nr:three-Cys-motif partner protein TcmP [Gemmatimonadales bacterium]
MPPRSAVWPIDEHTRGKHLVLGYYLDAWLPILGSTHGRVIFIDGFAGPGKYQGGEPGSPIIAMRAVKRHVARRANWDAAFLFVEADAARCALLRDEVDRERVGLPTTFHFDVECGDFAPTLNKLLDQVATAGFQVAPSFMMVDPFGISGAPMAVIRRFLSLPRAEVLVTFMVDFIDRFDETGEFPPHLDELYGTHEWAGIDTTAAKPLRLAAYCDLYRQQLKVAGATHVLQFDLYSGNRLVYALFHASRHPLACQRMKEALWRADPSGELSFRASRTGQQGLVFGADFSELRGELRSFLSGRDWTPV